MKRAAPRPLLWLAALLALYLCAPFAASVPQIGHADWTQVDWEATWHAVGVSVTSASVASLVILIGGVPLGYWLARSSSRAVAWLGFVVQLPLALPPLTSGVLLLFLVGPYSGIGQLFGGTLTDSFIGIVLAETFVAAPFLIIAARSAFTAVDPVLDDVAATLGHHAASRFFRVTLPIAWPAIGAGLALAWLRAFGEFGATVMVAYHPYSLPVYTYVMFGSQGLPAMMPLLLPTLAIAVVCVAASVYRRRGRTADAGQAWHDNGDALPAASRAEAVHADPIPRLNLRLRRTLGTFSLDIAWAPSTRRLAIIGPSGAGKSIALRMIAGLEPNENGVVTLGTLDLGALPPERRQVGYMPQDYGLFPHMTVARQLAFPVDADRSSARYWVEHLGLLNLLDRLPRQLSIGQRQRIALARALTRHSRVLLFDEPFSALDTPRRRRLQRSLRALQHEIAAVTVIVTHDPDEAALLADEILVVDQGRVLQAGPVQTLFAQPATIRVAELLGLRNVGQGTMSAMGKIEVAANLTLPATGHTIAVGRNVMWRVSPRAIRFAPDGPYAGIVEAVDLRGGDRHAVLDVAGLRFDVASEDERWQIGQPCRFAIDSAGVTAWESNTSAMN